LPPPGRVDKTTERTDSGSVGEYLAHARVRWGPLVILSINHVVTDGVHALVYPLLPAIASDLGLGYAQAALMHAAFRTAGAALQLPAGLLAERVGGLVLVLAGNAWLSAGLVAMGLAGSFTVLVVAAVVGGLGGNFQHPLGTSLVSRVYENQGRGRAIGTLNFSGDLGKLVGPAIVSVTAAWGWRVSLISGGTGAILLVLGTALWAWLWPLDQLSVVSLEQSHSTANASGWGVQQPWAVSAMVTIGVLDSTVRGAALTLLPFILVSKGLGTAQVSGLFTVVFAGGALGKFICGWIADRFGTLPMIWLTELCTGITAVLFIVTSGWVLLPLALLFGFALNGTSSILYVALAPLVTPERRARIYGIYYTATIGASSLAPVVYGAVGDRFGLLAAYLAVAAVTVLILPLAWANRMHLAQTLEG